MRRLRPIRRRRAREEEAERAPDDLYDDYNDAPGHDFTEPSIVDDLPPFVPVESAPLEGFAAPVAVEREDTEREEFVPEDEVLPVRLRRTEPRASVRFGALVLALLLIAAGAIGTLLNLDRLNLSVPEQWPVGVLAIAGVWLVVALNRRNVTSSLGAAALAGVAISALLDAQGVAPWRETLIGAVMVALGLGIVLRGLLLRQAVTS